MNVSVKMASFVGTKELYAIPMTRGAYNEYRGWEIPSDENPDEEGYLVEYKDGGAANDERHVGYISWSPKEVFEKSYRPNDDFKQRLEIEHDDLRRRLYDLNEFIEASPRFGGLDKQHQRLLYAQSVIMSQFSDVLVARIGLLSA